ncbi:carbohydrate ABC transporter permease [Paenibacillus sp. YYML68]|uniref:carbohydrate ABC transporter permease n=1 Tax=Paenibacillus sp. YYML68 TaxID=2909250 RepID=UPI002490B72E|nr:carbohydrate ABC transporter permease [Paenibacillus sp. YYML68]
METSKIKEPFGDQLFNVINYMVLSLFLIIVLYPLLYIVSASFSSSDAILSGRVWLWPVEPTLEGYQAVFGYRKIVTGFVNSFYYTVFGTIISVVLTILAAYPLSRKDLIGKHVIMFLFVFTMLFNGGLIPNYLLVKELGMLDTRWAILIPSALSVWNMIITRTYFMMNISDELLEAAKMDGCSDFTFLWKLVVPLSAPIIAVITLFYAVGQWNQFFSALIFLKDPNLYPLQLVMREILVQNQIDLEMINDVREAAAKAGLAELLKYALIIVSSLPVLAIYPFVQKYFVKGVMIGSLKG